MPKPKIIHILPHSYSQFMGKEFTIGFWERDWHAQVAAETIKWTNKYDIECWRVERKAGKVHSKDVNGVTHKIFPSMKFGKLGEKSFRLNKSIKEEVKKGNCIVHLHGIHTMCARSVLSNLDESVPIVGQHHGGRSFVSISNEKKNQIFKMLAKKEEKNLKKINHFFVLTKTEREELSQIVDPQRVEIQTMGVDFEKIKPIPQIEAREILQLPKEAKIILFVGRVNIGKGVETILDLFTDLKCKNNISLLIVGARPTDNLYQQAKSAGAIIVDRVEHEKIYLYYSSADVYVLPTPERFNRYPGIGIAPVEAMACGIPVISTQLTHFPTNDWQKIGLIPRSQEELKKQIEMVLSGVIVLKDIRSIARKYYDWPKIIENTICVYEKIIR